MGTELSLKEILNDAEDSARKKFGKKLDSEIVQVFLSSPMFGEFARLRQIPEDREEIVVDENLQTKVYIKSDLPEDVKNSIAYRIGQNGNLFFPISKDTAKYNSHSFSSQSSIYSTILIDLKKFKKYLESIPGEELKFEWEHSPFRQRLIYTELSLFNRDHSFLCRCSKGRIFENENPSSEIEKFAYRGGFLTTKIISKEEGKLSKGTERLLLHYGTGRIQLNVSGNYSEGYSIDRESFVREGCLADVPLGVLLKPSVFERLRGRD